MANWKRIVFNRKFLLAVATTPPIATIIILIVWIIISKLFHYVLRDLVGIPHDDIKHNLFEEYFLGGFGVVWIICVLGVVGTIIVFCIAFSMEIVEGKMKDIEKGLDEEDAKRLN